MVEPASRLGKIPPYLFGEIARLKAQALAEGRDLIDLGIGDPDQPTPQPIIDALTKAATDPETHRYDETPAGWTPFLGAVARWYARRFNVEIDPTSEALLLIGSKEGLAHLAAHDSELGMSHSVEEAEHRHRRKLSQRPPGSAKTDAPRTARVVK